MGHEWAVHLLGEHIRSGGVRHAYLFTGPAGVGKRTLAMRFAQALACKNPPVTRGILRGMPAVQNDGPTAVF